MEKENEGDSLKRGGGGGNKEGGGSIKEGSLLFIILMIEIGGLLERGEGLIQRIWCVYIYIYIKNNPLGCFQNGRP